MDQYTLILWKTEGNDQVNDGPCVVAVGRMKAEKQSSVRILLRTLKGQYSVPVSMC